ncbi:hypothetical protein HPB48_025376 [Haemaphysalis longicornis]|uniref:Uncharacterized protein n=1 Tax=Haemaphysalis longicornis TaxID=44386 RepID=A0A9J6H9R8_HAELO|nr:hypothetical protein HPB48_025376 [Haemaphysalis longicornis]
MRQRCFAVRTKGRSIWGTCFFRQILGDVQEVHMAFEAKDVDPVELPKDFRTFLSSLVGKVAIPKAQRDVLMSRLEDHLTPKPYLVYEFET